jgi:hypothetical protein
MYVRSVLEPVELPEGLAEMPPGPGLAAALAGIELGRVVNEEIVDLLRAQARQVAHEQARLLAAIAEVGRCRPVFTDRTIARLPLPHRYCADEIRAALAWTRRAADRQTDLAEAIVHGLPQVHAALLAGRIDQPKAAVFADHLAGLTDEQTTAVCAAVLPVAGRLTTSQIAARIQRMILAVDPAHYECRYRKALRDREVIGYLADDGTATLTVSGLSAADAAAALARVDALARAARRAGHRSTLPQIRADVVLGLLDGTLHGLDREQIITHLIAARSANDDPPAPWEAGPPGHTGDGASGCRASDSSPGGHDAGEGVRTTDGEAGRHPASADAGGHGHDHDHGHGHGHDHDHDHDGDGDGHADDGHADDHADDGHAGDGHDGHGFTPTGPGANRTECPGSPAGVGIVPPVGLGLRVGVEVRAELSTLLGLDDHPGEIAGWGPVPAAEARRAVAAQTRAEWRFAVTDSEGHLVFDGTTRRRPAGADRTGPRGGIVELQVPAAVLERLAADPAGCGPWSVVVADLAARYADSETAAGDRDAHPADRYPRAGLRRHVQMRDRRCVFVGCRCPAHRADQDHTLDHVLGGATVGAGLGPVCRHDHRLKHEGGWRLEQPEPGHFTWTSPLGRIYRTRPEPILLPLPDPLPRPPDPCHAEPAADCDEPPIPRGGPVVPDQVAPMRDPPPPALDEPPPF